MDLLSVRFESERVRRSFPVVPSLLWLSAGIVLVTAVGRSLAGGPLDCVVPVLQGAAVHGGFLAIGFLIALEGRPGWRGPAGCLAVAELVAFGVARLAPWGGLAFLVPPALLAWHVRQRPELRRVGAFDAPRLAAIVLGLAAGAFLGGHLLVSAALTFGYAVRLDRPAAYLTALAYDVGANALTAEWLLRGALFSHWWRHWGLWPAAAVSTVLGLVRYLLDPALPHTLEASAGAVFYLTLLGLVAAVLRAWTGSVVPGYLAVVVFFAAYRVLSVG
jgi:hypothetical protein